MRRLPVSGFSLVVLVSAVGLALASQASANSLYVANNSNADDVAQFSISSGGALSALSPATVGAGSLPFAVAVSPNGKNVYVTSGGGVSQEVLQY